MDLRQKLVSNTVDGQKMLGVGGLDFQFLAQLQNVVVHGTAARIIVIAPCSIQQFVPRYRPPGVREKESESLEFLSREHDLFAG